MRTFTLLVSGLLLMSAAPLACDDRTTAPATQPATLPALSDQQAVDKLVEILSARMPKDWAVAPIHKGKQFLWYWQPGEGDGVRINLLPRALLKETDRKPDGVYVWLMEPGFDDKPLPTSEWTGQPGAAPEEVAHWRSRRVLLWGGGDDWPTAKADILTALKATDAPAAETQPAATRSGVGDDPTAAPRRAAGGLRES